MDTPTYIPGQTPPASAPQSSQETTQVPPIPQDAIASDTVATDAGTCLPAGAEWKKPAIAAGAGIVAGAGGMLLIKALTPEAHAAVPGQELTLAELMTDGDVAVAHSVTDDMTFAEAFAAARTETGAGGVFTWRGNVYSTYTEAEWNAMTADEQNAYAQHFNWEGADQLHQDNQAQTEEVAVEDQPVRTVVMGHDDENNADYAIVDVADHQVVLVDADTDGTMDFMAADVNQDGQITPEEVTDLHQEGVEITSDDLTALMDTDTVLDA